MRVRCSRAPRNFTSSRVSAFTCGRALLRVQALKRRALRACTANRRFSQTDSAGNRLVIWKERANPCFTTCSAGRPAIGVVSRTMRPASGANMPEMVLNRVVLPAPFGPISACSLRSASVRSTPATAVNPPKRLNTPVQFRIAPETGGVPAQESGDLLTRLRGYARGHRAGAFLLFAQRRKQTCARRRPVPKAKTG